MLAEYYFEIKHVKGTDNTKADAFSQKAELQGNDKMSGTLLQLKKDGKIWYNYFQLVRTYKAPKSL